MSTVLSGMVEEIACDRHRYVHTRIRQGEVDKYYVESGSVDQSVEAWYGQLSPRWGSHGLISAGYYPLDAPIQDHAQKTELGTWLEDIIKRK